MKPCLVVRSKWTKAISAASSKVYTKTTPDASSATLMPIMERKTMSYRRPDAYVLGIVSRIVFVDEGLVFGFLYWSAVPSNAIVVTPDLMELDVFMRKCNTVFSF